MFPTNNDPVAVQHRTAAANAMTGARQNDDVPAYIEAAFDFLNWALPPMSLPVAAFYTVLSPKGHLIYLYSGGVAPDGTVVEGNGTVPDGCSNPVPGVRNILQPWGR